MIWLAQSVSGSGSSTAQIITACATIITALGGIILAIAVLIPNMRTIKTIHTIVNQQRTDAQRYQITLEQVLKKHGIEVPIDQSLPVPGDQDAKPGQPR